MTWQAVRATDEDGWTEEYLGQILGSYARHPLPPVKQYLGDTMVRWEELLPGQFHIRASGGSLDDRRLARIIVGSQLRAYGMEEATFTAGGPTLRKTADWNDIMQKARRLIESGQVEIHNNEPDVVAGTVQGDHGTYNVEISRQDPNSGVVSGWTCECPWNQFAWQRTRQWKPMEGRMCSHALAVQWLSQKMPLDTQYDPAAGAQVGPNGQLGLDMNVPQQTPGLNPQAPAAPAAPDQQLSIPGIVPGTAEAAPPAPPGKNIIPPFTPPMPAPVSIPGGKLPDPFNPIQYPGGTFSSVKTADTWDFSGGDDGPWGHKFVYNTADGKGIIKDQDEGRTFHPDMEEELGHNPWFGRSPNHGGTVSPDGLIHVYLWPSKQDHGPNTRDLSEDRHPYRLLQWIQQTVPHAYYPQSEEQLAEGDAWGDKIAATGDMFTNGEMVRINIDEQGIAEGKSEAHGSGQYRTITKNSIGEVLGQDPTTGWVDVIFPIHDAGPMEPYHIRAWLEPKDLSKMPNIKRPGPFIRRR